MKVCDYCGSRNELHAVRCRGCANELPQETAVPAPAAPPVEPPPEPEWKFDGMDMGFEVAEGLSHPDWKRIRKFIRKEVPKFEWNDAWNEAARRWLWELAGDLGGGCRVKESARFFFLSDLDDRVAQRLLDHAEQAEDAIRGYLGKAAWTNARGKHVVLVFSDEEDYYAYISRFFDDGTHPASTGICIYQDYVHIAMPFKGVDRAKVTLSHELVHNLLSHLALPRWLDEGLAETIAGRMAGRGLRLDPDFAANHRMHWNEGNIQTFWAGTSFIEGGGNCTISYELGQILLHKLSGNREDFIEFIAQADVRDAGQDAAVNFLNLDLGAVLGEFLGPGNWRPQRKAIAECWKVPAQ